MKKRFWKSDWFAGLVISLVFLFAAGSDVLQSVERKAYDLGVQVSTRDPGDKVAVIAIDDQSIANIGRWPWPREVHANMIEMLSAGQAKVIGNTVYFLEPQIDPGLSYINKISDFLRSSTIATVAPEAAQLEAMLKEAQSALNTDEKLAASIKQANNVVLAMPFTIGEPRGNPDKPLPDYVAKNSLPNIVDRINAGEHGLLPIPTISALSPIPVIGEAASAIGHLNANPDVDGAIRTEPLVLAFYDRMYPSLSLQVAAKYLNLAPVDVEVRLGEGVKLGRLNIATDTWLQMNTFFYAGKNGQPAFPVDSFVDVYSGKIPVEKYKGKIVLIGMTATGDGSDHQVTPISSSMQPIETLAHSVASILNEDFFISPSWALWAQLAAWLITALYLILLLPRLKPGVGAFATLGLLVVLAVTHFALMSQHGLWLQLTMPATLLLVGHGLLAIKRFMMAGKVKPN